MIYLEDSQGWQGGHNDIYLEDSHGWQEGILIFTCRIAREGREGTVSSPATARPPSLSTRRGRDRFLGRGGGGREMRRHLTQCSTWSSRAAALWGGQAAGAESEDGRMRIPASCRRAPDQGPAVRAAGEGGLDILVISATSSFYLVERYVG